MCLLVRRSSDPFPFARLLTTILRFSSVTFTMIPLVMAMFTAIPGHAICSKSGGSE